MYHFDRLLRQNLAKDKEYQANVASEEHDMDIAPPKMFAEIF